jgi:hypothetical protein
MDIWASRTPRKQAPLNINVGVLNIGNDPESQHSCGFQGFLRDDKGALRLFFAFWGWTCGHGGDGQVAANKADHLLV